MNANERYYRKTMQAIGGTMLLFLLFFYVFAEVYALLSVLTELLFADSAVAAALLQLFYGTGYLLSFMLPVAFLRNRMCKKNVIFRQPALAPKLSAELPLIVMAGIALVFAMSKVNASIVGIFSYSDFSADFLWGSMENMQPYELVLQFIVLCLVPGVCEEFLFRGAILTNCLPFGRSTAILISSLLFALMHQNGEQVLYAFAAGIVLGLVYERMGSIWCCTLLHVLNNFASLAEESLLSGLAPSGWSNVAAVLFEAAIFLLGMISACILVIRHFSQKTVLQDGFFGRSVPASDSYATHPVDAKRAVKLFFTPSMLFFLIFCTVQMLLLIVLAVLYAGG